MYFYIFFPLTFLVQALLAVVSLQRSSNQSLCCVWDVFFLGVVVVDEVPALSPVQSHLLCCPSQDLNASPVNFKQISKVEHFCKEVIWNGREILANNRLLSSKRTLA